MNMKASFAVILNPQFTGMIFIDHHFKTEFITSLYNDQLPFGSLAQVAEYCTSIAKVMGSIPVRAWIFSTLFSLLLKYLFTTLGLFSLFIIEAGEISWSVPLNF